MESTNCDLCDANGFDVGRMERFPVYPGDRWYPVLTCICRSCGHVFMNPRMSSEELIEHYSGQFRESFQVSRSESIGMNAADAAYLEMTLGEGEGRCAVEVGSYTGYMSKRLLDLGWEVEGIEPNHDSAQAARDRFGVTVHECMLEEFEPDKKYDLAFVAGVLEHVRSPTQVLLRLNGILETGGHVFIRGPDLEEVKLETVADVFHLDHPHTYSIDTLSMFAQKTGFRVKSRTVHNAFRRNLVVLLEKTTDAEGPLPFDLSNQYEKARGILEEYDAHITEQRRQVDVALAPLLSPEPKRIVVYGAGSHTSFLMNHTNLAQGNVTGIVDSNPKKWGTDFMGMKVGNFEEIDPEAVDAVVISSRAFQNEMYERVRHLEDKGVEVVRLYDTESSRYPTG